MTLAFNAAANFNPLDQMYMPVFSSWRRRGSYPGIMDNPFINDSDRNSYNPKLRQFEDLAIERAVKNLSKSIEDGSGDRTLRDFEKFKKIYMNSQEYKWLTNGGTEELDKHILNELLAKKFEEKTGINLEEHIDNNIRGNFFSGLWTSLLSFGLDDYKSCDDINKELFGREKTFGDKIGTYIGSIINPIGFVIKGIRNLFS